MDEKIFNSLSTYGQIYYYLAEGSKSKDDVMKYLKDGGKSNTTAGEHVKKAVEGLLPYITCEADKLVLDRESIGAFIKELSGRFLYEASLEAKGKKKKKPEDEYGPVMTAHSQEYQNLKAQVNSAKTVEKNLKARIKKKDAEIAELKKLLSNKIDDIVLHDMTSKILVIGSAKVKPKEKFQRDFFLDDPVRLLDVENLARKYGGEIDNPYEPILSAEKELTTDNYLKRIGKILLKGKLFQSRLEEQERFPVVNSLEKQDESWIKRDSINRVEIEKNRLESVNELLATNGISNQMKLSLYATWFDSVDLELVELLDYAGELDVNADYVIRLLEKPKEYRNYRTIRGLLKQAKKASEAHIKREAAIELISGEWYVEAVYRGEPCRFQMMPVNEMRVFLELLKNHRTDEAIAALEQLLEDKRKSSSEDGEIDGTILVTDVTENDKSKSDAKKKRQIEPPKFLHDKEAESGVNCHPKVNDDEAFDDFVESEQEESNGEE